MRATALRLLPLCAMPRGVRTICHGGRLLLVDAHNLAYRMHYALPPMTTAVGEPTNALHGFCRKLVQFQTIFEGHRQVVVFDSPGRTFRSDLSAEYKENRTPMPTGLRKQIDLIREGCECLGVATFTVPGVEADDVIATLAACACASSAERVIVVSSDKDLLQLISADSAATSVRVWDDRKKALLDQQAVVEKLGVTPALICDFLALTGDSSDNVAGVPGVGPKTAAKLLNEHGSLEHVLAAAPSMKKSKRQQALVEFAARAREAKSLVELRSDVQLELDLVTSKPSGALVRDKARLRAFCERNELKQLMRQLL